RHGAVTQRRPTGRRCSFLIPTLALMLGPSRTLPKGGIHMFERILVPVDGSPLSEEILPYGRGLAEATGAELALLRVVAREAERAAAQRDIDALAAEVSAQAGTVVVADDPAGTILAEA